MKFAEISALIPNLQQLEIELPELQEIDSKKIIESKLNKAFEHHSGEFIVEDTSLTLEGMNGLPGPLIKWFLQTIKKEGIYNLTKVFGSNAVAKVIIGYAKSPNHIEYFEGVLEGDIVSPRGDNDIGWNTIFQPKGFNKTFGEMTMDEKNQISMRRKAVDRLKEYLGL